MDVSQIIAIAVFVVAMAAIMTEKVHRTLAAIVGASVLLLLHVMTFDQAMSHIDFNTLGVLFGMMLFVAVVRQSGLFEYLAIKSAKLAKGDPWFIMVLFVALTALLSAFLDNVTTVLLMGPMTVTLCKLLDINPVPYFMAEIMSSNIGGTATLIGDPPNIMIGSAAGFTFADFIAVKDKTLLIQSLVVMAFTVAGFMGHGVLGIESSVVALTAAGVLLLVSRRSIEKGLAHVEWTTLAFFAGLFIIVGGLVETGVMGQLAQGIMGLTGGNVFATMLVLLAASALVSSFLDNIPFVATMIPILLAMESSGMDVTSLWWAVSLGACLGGNGTLIGASANVVLSDISAKNGYTISFMGYLKVGFPIMVVTVAIAAVYLVLRFPA